MVSPMYIAEISPAAFRGRLVAVTQFNIVLGVLLAFFSNYWLAQSNLGAACVALDVWCAGFSRPLSFSSCCFERPTVPAGWWRRTASRKRARC